ncbi:MAG: NAD+ synthase [Nitrospirae bacterium]|nr:NAD+ synthase [Nitrospirota bacterium]
MRTLRIALAQINCTVGDLEGNTEKICEYVEKAKAMEADLVAFPEMAIPGYPPEDLLLKPQFAQDNLQALQKVIKQTKGIAAIVGVVDRRDDIYNGAALIHDGGLVTIYHKIHLPNYGVFDEYRYFQAGTECPVIVVRDVAVGVNICEDLWHPEGPALTQSLGGDAEVIVSINASPYHRGKTKFREQMLATRARDNSVIVTYTNMVGGQDELVFDGQSAVFDQNGQAIIHGRAFEEELILADLNIDGVFRTRLRDPRRRTKKLAFMAEQPPVKRFVLSHRVEPAKKRPLHPKPIEPLHPLTEVYRALTLGVRDYVTKNGFSKVVIGVSGGIDSALTALIAADALGKENVVGVLMPSQYTSAASEEDSRLLAKALGIKLLVIPIQEVFSAYLKMFSKEFKGRAADATEENLQARIRGNILMALSNKFGWLVLTTGNKSEMSVGYATLYGDMAGGFAVIKDVPKTLVYELANHRNSQEKRPIIPQRVFKRPPTAELRPGQTDQDTLPPYSVLDPIVVAHVEEDVGFEELVSMGFDRRTVEKVIRMVDRSEYKRRQAPIGIKITPRAFGKDRRVPITNQYKEIQTK